MCPRMQDDGSVDNRPVLSPVFRHSKFLQAIYIEDIAEAERLEIFGSHFCQEMWPQFLRYDPTRGDWQGAFAVEGPVEWLARLNARDATVVQSLAGRETPRRYRKRLYVNTYGAILRIAVEQPAGSIKAFLKYWGHTTRWEPLPVSHRG